MAMYGNSKSGSFILADTKEGGGEEVPADNHNSSSLEEVSWIVSVE